MKKTARSIVMLLAITAPSFADGECRDEMITSVTAHKDGNIYFNSTKSCITNWCAISANYTSEAKKNMFMLLMTAKENQTPVNIAWANIPSGTIICSQQAALTQPGYITAK